MMRFCGYELELSAGQVLEDVEGMRVRAGTDVSGGHWLIVQVDDDTEHLVWVCAPISVRALRQVASGNARVRDALRHSATGTVMVVTVDHGRAVPDQCVLCARIPAALLPGSEVGVALAA